MSQKNIEKPTKINKTDFPESKYIKSRTLGDIRAEKKMKEFCANFKAFDNPIWVCKQFWYEILYPSERDTKMYFRTLSRELFDFIGSLVGWFDDKWLNEGIDSYLRKFEDNKHL